MTYDVYMYVFYGGAALALLFLLLSVILFVALRIPSVIGELSGSTARKAIENIRKQNELGSSYSSEAVTSHGKHAGKKDKNGFDELTSVRKSNDHYSDSFLTTKIITEQLSSDAKKSYETTLLENTSANETTVLNESEYGGTTVLQQPSAYSFCIEYEIMLIHTNEIIN